MTYELMTVARCAELCGLGPEEIVLGVSPSAMHDSLFDSYLLQRHLTWAGLRDMIVADLRMALDLGAKKRAADLLIVLRRFLSARRRGVGESASFAARPRAPRGRESKPTSAAVVEFPCATRKETFERQSTFHGSIVSLEVVRDRRRSVAGGSR